MTLPVICKAIGLGLGILSLVGCATPKEAHREAPEVKQGAFAGTVVAELQVNWPADDPDEAAGAIIDRIADALRIEGDSGGGPEMPLVVEARSDRQLVVRFDVGDRCSNSSSDPDAAFRYSWTTDPAANEVVVHARSVYLGAGSVGELQCPEENMYKNMPSMVLYGIMMAPK